MSGLKFVFRRPRFPIICQIGAYLISFNSRSAALSRVCLRPRKSNRNARAKGCDPKQAIIVNRISYPLRVMALIENDSLRCCPILKSPYPKLHSRSAV